MKLFLVTLKNNRQMIVEADSYHHEGEQYVFDGVASGDVEFVMADDVISITVLPPSNVSGGGPMT